MKNESLQIEEVVSMIYFIRNEKVMLDRDLARLYGVNTKALKQAVRRNRERFPDDFMFELGHTEYSGIRSQIVTIENSNTQRGKHSKYGAFAFTEPGIAMLSSVLNSKTAIQVNIQIIRAFIKIRKEIAGFEKLITRIDGIEKDVTEKFSDQEEKIQLIFEAIKQLLITKSHERRKIGYKQSDL
jgi:hypothetical protein